MPDTVKDPEIRKRMLHRLLHCYEQAGRSDSPSLNAHWMETVDFILNELEGCNFLDLEIAAHDNR